MIALANASDDIAALQLPPEYVALARKMAPAVRDVVVYNRDPSSVPMNDLLNALGMPPVEAPPMYPGLRSLALLNLLPKPTGSRADVVHEPIALPAQACAALREAVDSASFSAADSVDGCTDYQLNLTREALESFVGSDAVARLWATAARALHKVRPGEYDDEHGDGGEAQGNAAQQLLEAHEIFVRSYTGETRPWFPFHKDRSELTVNVALADDALHDGGRLVAIYDGAVRCIPRREGDATLHPSSLMHAVTRMSGAGKRYALIIFFGRNARIVAFNREVKKMLTTSAEVAIE